MRLLVRLLDEWIPYLDHPELPVHEDPDRLSLPWASVSLIKLIRVKLRLRWHRDQRYAERLGPGTKFADIIGEIDPAANQRGQSWCRGGFGTRLNSPMHRGILQ